MTPRPEPYQHPPSNVEPAHSSACGAAAGLVDAQPKVSGRFIAKPPPAMEDRASLALRRLVTLLARGAAREMWAATSSLPMETDRAG
jgi:hypothetical protein